MMKSIGAIALNGGLALLCVASLGSYVAWSWPWELFSHFRVQYLLASLVAVGLLLILRQWKQRRWQWLIALVLVAVNAVAVVPWYLPHSQQATTAVRSIRVVSANVNIENTNYADTIAAVQSQQPDLALFIEVNPAWVTELTQGLGDRLPYQYKTTGGGLFWMSRLPLENPKSDRLGGKDMNAIATVKIQGKPVQVIGTHPMVPIRGDTFARRTTTLQALVRYLPTVKQPVILLGDFNLSPWSPHYRQFIDRTKLHNTRLGLGVLPSWPLSSTTMSVPLPNWSLAMMQIPIDHCLVSYQFGVVNTQVKSNGSSDHAILVADLVLR